ncbi:MAG: aminotransferase class V-fold PLP-dependent enzyme [Thiohalocapsa sp.]|uniref:aminotransferase class V-fold PLP-dependent enzyme n=1 Tax=Thiohalocapsa sp. TaxID=2497641 RepID=UPI0025DBA415|nr:aminotransferase class V-fold PLP-dependent enzyme [Thiohalocapsa sp.]MCG6940512.1 aminotransferase class V-fold PLP-dependent enzyme [Thiohalocapsa sp.]
MSNLFQDELRLDDGLIYLNHAAIAPWPARTVAAVQALATSLGRTGSKAYLDWVATERRLRERLAALIGAASADDIALSKSTSEALSFVAEGLDWQSGDNVVGIRQEFPSNRIVWEALAARGVEYRQLDLDTSTDPEADLLALCDDRSRLCAVSWVQYASGLRLDLARLGSELRERGVLFCVDGIQGLGALPFDLAEIPADFIAADGHKWMLGPEGLALFWVRPALRETLKLTQYGWHMVEHAGDFDRKDWRPAASARRFEAGSPNMLGIHALEASLSLLLAVGLDAIGTGIAERSARLVELIDRHGLELLSPRAPERRAGIVTFRVPGVDNQALYRALMQQDVMCAHRGGGLRFSPHAYTPMEQLDQALEQALAAAQGAPR